MTKSIFESIMYLKNHCPEAIDIRFTRSLPGVEALGGDVPKGARDTVQLGIRCLLIINGTSQAKVPKPGIEIYFEHNVAGLEVAVEDLLVILVVEVAEGRGNTGQDLIAEVPAERRLLRWTEDVAVEAPVGHVVVDQKQHPVLVAPPCCGNIITYQKFLQ